MNSSQSLPSGTLTFLFTDIEGSTHKWEQYPEEMRAAMRRHDELIESAVEQQVGKVVRPRGEGDSRFAVFTRASDAVRAAVAIQHNLLNEPWSIPALRVRIALHSGEAELREGDYYGNTINRCARLRSAAHGGQILVSQATACLLQDELPYGVNLLDLGEHKLNNLKRPEHIYQVTATNLPTEFPPLNIQDETSSNLPLAITTFVGREKEVDELQHLLEQARLLTILGTGGAGKTRLAVQLTQNLRINFPDGTWFIDLAPLSKSTPLVQYLMNVLGMREEANRSPQQTFMDHVQSKRMLLILDNCEHLLPELALFIETILRGAPRLRILATSREKLGVPGEVVWRIPPLSSPDPQMASTIEDMMQSEAMQLFQDRAKAARMDFKITRENAGAVAKICANLDGIPLAIELAAARVGVLSVEEIVTRLDDRFHLLVGNRTAHPRQQTLRALLDWSYDLLNEKEQLLLQRLAVFSGSWTVEAAEQVCSGGKIDAAEVLDLLTCLIDKSFVIGEIQQDYKRYRFLETIFKFAHNRLSEGKEADEFAQKHAEYFLKLARKSYGKMWGPEQAYWLRQVDDERDNMRTALEWLSQAAGNEEKLLRMAGTLWRYWDIRGYISEGRTWMEAALAKDSHAPDFWRANGMGGAGHLARQQGDYMRAKELHEQSLALFRKLGCKLGSARQLNALGEIARFLGDYKLAVELHEQSLSLRYEIGDKEGIAVSLRQLGVITRDWGQYPHAQELLEQSLKLERELGDRLLQALTLNDLGLVAYCLCDYEKAISLFEQGMAIYRELNDRSGISNSIQNLGNAAKVLGDFKKAELLYSECLALKKELGDKRGVSRVTASMAEVAFRQGKYPLAADLAGESLSLSRELGLKRGILTSMVVLGYVAYYQGDYERSNLMADEILALSVEMEAFRAIGYAEMLLALGKYSAGNLAEAREKFQEAVISFQKINDRRNIAGVYVNLARTAYRQDDPDTAMNYINESLAISKDLHTRWTYGFVLEIMGLLERNAGNYEQALELFQESLRLSVEQENQQGIANCLGALAGMAVMANQAARAARLFAASARLRRDMGAKMSSNDHIEYEKYLTMVHENLDHATFEAEWAEGFSSTTEKIIEDLKEWSGDFKAVPIPEQTPHSLENAYTKVLFTLKRIGWMLFCLQ